MHFIINISKKYVTNYSNVSKECWQSVFLTFIEALATGICFFLSLYFVNVLHMSVVVAGFLVSTYGVGTIFGGYISGKLSDYYPAKLISTLSLLVQSMAFFLFTQLENEISLLINMFVVGFCTCGFMTSNNVWMLRQCQNKSEMRLKSININRAASNLGMGISGVIIGFVEVSQFHSIFCFSSIVLILSAIYFHFLINDDVCLSFPEYESIGESDSNTHKKYKWKVLLLMLNCIFLISLVISQLSITYPIYIQQLFPQMGTSAVSLLFILDTMLIVLLQIPLINRLKNVNKIVLVGFGAFLMGLGMFLLNFVFVFLVAIISCVIWTLGEIIFIGIAHFVCYEFGAEMKKGQTIGVVQAVSATGRVLGPILGGCIYYQYGGQMLWTICMVVGVHCFLLCVYFKNMI